MNGLRELLAEALGRKWQRPVEVRSMQPAPGAAAATVWMAEIQSCKGVHTLVLRCDGGGFTAAQIHREVRGLRLAERAGVPAPRIIVSSAEVDLGCAYVITDSVAGTAVAPCIRGDATFDDARRNFSRECGEILGLIHRAAWAADGWERTDAMALAEEYRIQSIHPSAVLDDALAWLAGNRPPALAAHVPVHGDFRPANLMMGASGITAVLGWRHCHLGDPDEDLGRLCSRAWRQGAELLVADLGTLEELLETYEAVAGRTVNLQRLHWWMVYAVTLWGLTCNRSRSARGSDSASAQGLLNARGDE